MVVILFSVLLLQLGIVNAKNKVINHAIDGILLCLYNLPEIVIFFC